MATKRQRPSGKWEFIVKNKAMLAKPWSGTFDTEAEGDAYCAKLEACLARGIVPDELTEKGESLEFLREVIRHYLLSAPVSDTDRQCIGVLHARIGATRLKDVNYKWVQAWITGMKRDLHLAPSTIKHHVGALGRCFDWASREGVVELAANPIRMLPKRYAQYTEADSKQLRAVGKKPRKDQERDRRLHPDEESSIREILSGKRPGNRQRSLELRYQKALELLFDLALESAMRLREMFTLELGQINLAQRTIFLDKTKNGEKRQIPLTTVAVKKIKAYLERVKKGNGSMLGFSLQNNLLFPWWDGQRTPDGKIEKASMIRTTTLLSKQFSRIFDAAGCPDFHFHDLRHEATSRYFERSALSDLKIAKITGHKDPRMLMRYANLRPSSLADQLW